MKRFIIFILLIFLVFLFSYPVFPQTRQKVLYNCNGLIVTKTKAIYKGKVLYDAVEDHKKEEVYEGEGEIVYLYSPLSLIGPYYSYQYYFYQFSGSDGSKSNSYCNFKTVNLTSSAKVSILDLVEEASLVAALKKDAWVLECVHNQGGLAKLNSCKTFNEMLKLEALSDGFGNKFDDNSFAFFKYDKKTGLVALRLFRNDYIGFDHSTRLQLGLWVKPKTEIKKFLDLKSNFFYGKYKETQYSETL